MRALLRRRRWDGVGRQRAPRSEVSAGSRSTRDRFELRDAGWHGGLPTLEAGLARFVIEREGGAPERGEPAEQVWGCGRTPRGWSIPRPPPAHRYVEPDPSRRGTSSRCAAGLPLSAECDPLGWRGGLSPPGGAELRDPSPSRVRGGTTPASREPGGALSRSQFHTEPLAVSTLDFLRLPVNPRAGVSRTARGSRLADVRARHGAPSTPPPDRGRRHRPHLRCGPSARRSPRSCAASRCAATLLRRVSRHVVYSRPLRVTGSSSIPRRRSRPRPSSYEGPTGIVDVLPSACARRASRW